VERPPLVALYTAAHPLRVLWLAAMELSLCDCRVMWLHAGTPARRAGAVWNRITTGGELSSPGKER